MSQKFMSQYLYMLRHEIFDLQLCNVPFSRAKCSWTSNQKSFCQKPNTLITILLLPHHTWTHTYFITPHYNTQMTQSNLVLRSNFCSHARSAHLQGTATLLKSPKCKTTKIVSRHNCKGTIDKFWCSLNNKLNSLFLFTEHSTL